MATAVLAPRPPGAGGQRQEDPQADARELQPKRRRQFVATTDSDHGYPIFRTWPKA